VSQDVQHGLAVIQQQLKELDAIAAVTLQDLNTVAGTERVAKWKVRMVARVTEAVGQTEGKKLAAVHPGPSFTNDMVEEFTDLIDCYRTPLAALAKQLAQATRPSTEG
jgi:sirohydrochlorin ferrochelatase